MRFGECVPPVFVSVQRSGLNGVYSNTHVQRERGGGGGGERERERGGRGVWKKRIDICSHSRARIATNFTPVAQIADGLHHHSTALSPSPFLLSPTFQSNKLYVPAVLPSSRLHSRHPLLPLSLILLLPPQMLRRHQNCKT